MPNPVGNPNIAEAGKATQFSKLNPPKNPGRKPSILKKWMKDYKLSKSDFDYLVTNFLFAKNIGEIEKLINTKELRDKLPAAIYFQLQILVNQAKKGDGRHIENMFYMLFGRPVQPIDLNPNSGEIPDDPDECNRLIEQLEQELSLTMTVRKTTVLVPEEKLKNADPG
jgi:hypothetical protein